MISPENRGRQFPLSLRDESVVMRSKHLLLILVATCPFFTGCGGCGVSANQMKKYAQRKSAPDDLPPPPATAAADKGKTPDKAAAETASNPEATAKATPGAIGPMPAVAAAPEGPMAGNEKPEEPLTEAGRRARSIANLEKIGKALTAYVAKRNKYPPVASQRDGDLLLSWRVLILPELGYQELYARFERLEPWDSKHNKLLLDYIPREYQSPERFDNKTNYLAVSGRGMVFFTDGLQEQPGLPTVALTDGAANTVAVVEVDDKYALEWTRPSDHSPVLDAPADRLGGLRGEGAFSILATGRVVLLPKDLPPARLAALFTATGGEPLASAKSFLSAPTAEPPPPMVATIADDPTAAGNQTVAADMPPTATDAAASSATASAEIKRLVLGEGFVPDPGKLPVPDDGALAKSRELLKTLYEKEYAQARTREEQNKFVSKLIAELPSVEQNPADLHELARIVRDMAVAIGDVRAALVACDLLEQRFQIDPLPQRLKLLQDIGKRASGEAAYSEAVRLIRQAQDADRYDIAIPAHEALLVIARAVNKPRNELARLQLQLDEMQESKSLLAAAQRGLAALKNTPGDADASEDVGRYLCFIKHRWEAGLPYLARSDDIRLRGIASLELSSDRSAASLLSLADQYWELTPRFKQPQRRGLHLRAAWCYELVSASLAGSLEKIKAQRRIDEAVSLYGQAEVDRVLAPLRAIRTGQQQPQPRD